MILAVWFPRGRERAAQCVIVAASMVCTVLGLHDSDDGVLASVRAGHTKKTQPNYKNIYIRWIGRLRISQNLWKLVKILIMSEPSPQRNVRKHKDVYLICKP